MRLQTNKNCNTSPSSFNLTGDFDQVVKGNIKITHNSNGNSNDYIIKFKKVGLFLVYQTWSNDNEDVNKNRKAALVNSKKWVELFNNYKSNLDDSFTFTPTTVMEIKNKKYLFVINEAFFNEKDKLIFKVSTNEIKLSTGMNEKLKIIPLGCHENVRFDIDSLSSDSKGIKALVITCIDYRLIDEAVTYLNEKGFENQYDEFILAGASLGYTTSLSTLGYSGWSTVLDDHINISYNLHKIKDVIVMDHMDCGAYKAQYNEGKLFLTPYAELQKHIENLNSFRNSINQKYTVTDQTDPNKIIPKFNLKTWLMSIDGSVDQMPTYWQPDSTTFTLSQNNVVIIGSGNLPSSFTSIGSLPSPTTTTSTTPLKYKLLNSDGSEITTTNSNYIFASVKSYSDGDGNIIWYIQNLQTGPNFYENLTELDENWVDSISYRVQVIGAKAYVNLKMTTTSVTSDSTTILSPISFEFTNANYL
jgi:hypothetical protein